METLLFPFPFFNEVKVLNKMTLQITSIERKEKKNAKEKEKFYP